MSNKRGTQSEWNQTKINKIESLGFLDCYCCGRPARECHHCFYRENPKSVQLDDLIYLCGFCHVLVHAFHNLGMIESYDLRNISIINQFKFICSKIPRNPFDGWTIEQKLKHKETLLNNLKPKPRKTHCNKCGKALEKNKIGYSLRCPCTPRIKRANRALWQSK